MPFGIERRPRCPFCEAPWTAAMMAQYDAATRPGCACGIDHGTVPPETLDHAPAALPTEDIACAACKRVIYRALANLDPG